MGLLLRTWLYVFAGMNVWLTVMSRADRLVQEHGREAMAEGQRRLAAARGLRQRWVWRVVLAELERRRPPVSAASPAR
jgi:hypothetical protein